MLILCSFFCFCFVFFFKQKTAYEMRISDWSSDVCSSDLRIIAHHMGSRRCRADIAHGLSRYFAIHSEGSGPYRDCGGAVSVEGKCASMESGVAPQRQFRQAKVAGRRIWLLGEGGWGADEIGRAHV